MTTLHDLLARAGEGPALRGAAIALAGMATSAVVYACACDEHNLAMRLAASYVARLDAQLQSVFLTRRGRSIAWGQVATSLSLATAYAFTRSGALVWLVAVALVAPPVIVRVLVHRRRRKLDDQVHGFALALANALKTTASIGDALWATVSGAQKPLRDEVEIALKQLRVGSALEEALLAMAGRAQSRALDVLVSALLIGRQAGGDLPRILESTAASLREVKRLEEMTERVTYSAKQSLAIAACITGGIALALPYVMPGFLEPLRTTLRGQIVAAQCALVSLLALYLGYRFTRSDP